MLEHLYLRTARCLNFKLFCYIHVCERQEAGCVLALRFYVHPCLQRHMCTVSVGKPPKPFGVFGTLRHDMDPKNGREIPARD